MRFQLFRNLLCAFRGHALVSDCYAIHGDESALVMVAECGRCGVGLQTKLSLPEEIMVQVVGRPVRLEEEW